jgi:hypothetical protein
MDFKRGAREGSLIFFTFSVSSREVGFDLCSEKNLHKDVAWDCTQDPQKGSPVSYLKPTWSSWSELQAISRVKHLMGVEEYSYQAPQILTDGSSWVLSVMGRFSVILWGRSHPFLQSVAHHSFMYCSTSGPLTSDSVLTCHTLPSWMSKYKQGQLLPSPI